MRYRAALFLIAGVWATGAVVTLGAAEIRPRQVEVWTGVVSGDLEQQENLRSYPVAVAFTFPLRNERFALQLEPMLEWASRPDSRLSGGLAGFVRYDLTTGRIRPYLKVGSGPYYLGVDTVEQSTRFNFASYFCAGIRMETGKTSTISVEYRYRHISNANIEEPNSGINGSLLLIGIGRRI